MSKSLFPERIETDRLLLERITHKNTDYEEVYDLTTTESWQTTVTEHMPWFGFDRLDQICGYVDHCEQQWADREKASYSIRPRAGEDRAGQLVGFASYGPDWEERRAGSGIVLAEPVWGRGYGGERAAAMVDMTFGRHRLDAYYTEIAVGNDRSRRMVEKYVERFGGRHEGMLRQYRSRTNGEVPDYHRYSITRDEYENAVENATS